jgi:hypothetical protein
LSGDRFPGYSEKTPVFHMLWGVLPCDLPGLLSD